MIFRNLWCTLLCIKFQNSFVTQLFEFEFSDFKLLDFNIFDFELCWLQICIFWATRFQSFRFRIFLFRTSIWIFSISNFIDFEFPYFKLLNLLNFELCQFQAFRYRTLSRNLKISNILKFKLHDTCQRFSTLSSSNIPSQVYQDSRFISWVFFLAFHFRCRWTFGRWYFVIYCTPKRLLP